MDKGKITLLEKIAIHSVDIPEMLIGFFKGDSRKLSEIYEAHEKRYGIILRKVREYEGNVPMELRDKILTGSQTCSKIRFYTACTRVRMERAASLNSI
jgi:hypothetical protein